MKKNRTTQSAFVNVCIFLGLLVFFAGILVALFAATDPQSFTRNGNAHVRGQVAFQSLPPAAYMKRGLLGIMEPAMAMMKPGLLPLTTPGMCMSQERAGDWEH